MQKLVVLKLDGDLVEGVRVTLEIGKESERPTTEIRGSLPPKPELVTQYERWQSAFRSLEASVRITPIKVSRGNSLNNSYDNCRQLGNDLSHQMNSWLNCESFRPVKEKFLKQLMPDDTVRVLIKTDDIWLRRLPWHSWDIFEDYPKAEVALSAPQYEQIVKKVTKKDKVKILAILGNSDGIDLEKDRQILEQLPDAETIFFVEPTRYVLNKQLWEQDWDILFFAGHSSSEEDCSKGKVFINQTDSLTIHELKYALKKAVESGLQLAIFNSCDGLGLAHELEDLQIPQILVMRELVPDRVAQEFLTDFLTQFSSGEPFCLAARKAREKLQGLEDEFPCASWLPAICQIPAAVSLTWEQLRGNNPIGENTFHLSNSIVSGRAVGESLPNSGQENRNFKQPAPAQSNRYRIKPYQRDRLRVSLITSAVVTVLVLGVRYLGMLQAWELQAYDQLMRMRPDEGLDSRLLVVTVSEKDLELPQQENRKGSLSDRALALLLKKLESYQPRAIGLDTYRDSPVDPKEADLITRMRRNDGLFAICKVSDPESNDPGIRPPRDVPIERQGFSDAVKDPDGVLRRHLLAMNPSPASPCTTPYALSAQLAFHYLEAEGISAQYTPKGDLQLGNVTLKRLQNHMGGYQNVDAWGYQILLNYRSYRSPAEIAPVVTLTEVLTGSLKPDEVKGRVVLIGVSAQSFHDYIPTPFSSSQGLYQEMPGVIAQAQMVSQLLSAVKDRRPLLSVWPFWGEGLWIWGWSVLGSVLVWRWRSRLYLLLAVGTAIGVLYIVCFGLFIQGYWVPLAPSLLAFAIASSSVLAYLASRHQLD